MVARIKPHQTHTHILRYNERKVAQERARFLHAKNFLQDDRHLTRAEKSQRFQRQNDLNTRAQDKMLHISLNFAPGETLSDDKMRTIADRYMEGLRMQAQPYLVYRHTDAGHPHLHIVTTLIQSDGRRINNFQMGRRLSSPTRKAIEKEFGLVPARKRIFPQKTDKPLQKIHYGPDSPLLEQINNNLHIVHRDYRFTSLAEYNAILRTINLNADPGSPDSRTRQHSGLHYQVLDDRGQRIGVPVRASDLTGPFTFAALDNAYTRNQPLQQSSIPAIRQRVDWSLLQNPYTLRGLILDLQQEGIDLVVYQNKDHRVYGLTYVDHNHKTAVTGSDLGKPYTAASILKSLTAQQYPDATHKQQKSGNRPDGKSQPTDPKSDQSHRPTQSPTESPGPYIPPIPGFSRLMPQALGQLMQYDPTFGSNPQELQEDQRLRKRRKL